MKTDRIFGCASALLGLLFVFLAVPSITGDWQQGEQARYFTVGPRLFPYISGILVTIFAVLIAIKPDGINKMDDFLQPGAARKALFAIALAFVYVVLLDSLGFVIASVLALFTFFLGFGERRWKMIVPIAVIVPIAISAMFAGFFKVALPPGLFAISF